MSEGPIIGLPENTADALVPARCPLDWHPRTISGAVPDLGWEEWKLNIAKHVSGLLLADAAGARFTSGAVKMLRPLAGAGLPDDAPSWAGEFMLAEALAGYAPIPTATVSGKLLANRLWETSDPGDQEGQSLTVLPVFEWDDRQLVCIDALAWSAERPGKVHQRVGLIAVLGGEWKLYDAPLRLHATAANWAACGAERGVWLETPADWHAELMALADQQPIKGWGTHIVCDDRSHGEAVHALLHRPIPKPKFPEVGFVRPKSVRSSSEQAA